MRICARSSRPSAFSGFFTAAKEQKGSARHIPKAIRPVFIFLSIVFLSFGSFLILKPSYDKGLHHFERRLAEENHTISELVFGPLILYPEGRSAVLNNTPLSLTPTEFDFLTYLVEHQDRAVSRDELLKNLWQYNWQADTRAADDLVKRLRRKLRECKSSVRIETVWGFGFRLEKESVS